MAEKKKKPGREYITALERGLAVLRCFSRDTPEMTISEISTMTGLNPAVTRRCLHTLAHLGYVGRRGKLFILRAQVMSLGAAFLESMDVEETFRPHLQELSDLTGNSTSISCLSEGDIIFLVYVSTAPTIHHFVGVGTRLPAYVSALGRSLLAFQPKQDIERYLKALKIKKYTNHTVTSVPQLRTILANVRKQGYACVESEIDPLIVSLAIPVFSPEGDAIAAINCSTSTVNSNAEEMISTKLSHLYETGRKIEMEFRRNPLLAHSVNSIGWESPFDILS